MFFMIIGPHVCFEHILSRRIVAPFEGLMTTQPARLLSLPLNGSDDVSR